MSDLPDASAERTRRVAKGILWSAVVGAGCTLIVGVVGALALWTLLAPCLGQTW